MLKKVLATVLALVMAFGVFAMSASAATDVIYGDMNGDTNVNASDALVVLQMATGLKDATDYELAIADVNADAKTNSTDALLILQLSTDLIKSFNKSYDKTLKATKVDPVFANGSFTFSIAMYEESVGNFDMVLSTDGKSKVIATIIPFKGIIPIEVRLLNKGGKNYQVLPEIKILDKRVEGTGTYCEINEDISKMFDDYVRIFTSEVVFGSSSKTVIAGDEYVCETFYNLAGAKFELFFLGDKLEIITISNKGKTQTFDLTNLEKGADTTRLVIPSDYKYDDSMVK